MSGYGNIDQTTVVAMLGEQWAAIDDAVSALAEEQWRLPTALPGWDVHAVVAHMVGTELLLSGTPTPEVDVSGLAHVRNPMAVLNEQWVISLRPLSGAELLDRFREITASRLETLAHMSTEQWLAESMSPVGQVPYGRFMRVRLFDCWMHEADIRDATGAGAGDEGGPRGELAFLDVLASLGYAVGKRGAPPAGSRIAIELSGPLARTINIEVAGRARIVDELDGEPTITIGLDSRLFTRLCGGRTTAAAHAGEYLLGGDVTAGQRIIDNLAFVI